MHKKHVKIAAFTALMLACLGWWGYSSYWRPDPQVQEQLNQQFGSEFFNSFPLEEPAGAEPVATAAVERIEPPRTVQAGTPPISADISGSRMSEEEIINQYVPQFRSLEKTAASRLDALFAAALQEYRQQKQAGTLNLSELARKYIQAGTRLEANVDGQFYASLNAMQAELEANNQSTAVIAEIKQEYAAAKAQKRAELLAQARR